MATAEQSYVDPSALSRLYLHQEGSREIAAWRRRAQGTLPVTHHGRLEVINAISLAAFRGDLESSKTATLLNWLEEDFANGRLMQADILWRAALNRAVELSQHYTPRLGTRSLDVLHVACALELKLHNFLTFDMRQQNLAAATGLRLIRI